MKYTISEYNGLESGYKINDKLINKVDDYEIRDREDLVDSLIDWISEATTDKEIMKDDLKYLMSITDKYIISSMSTNEYLTEKEGQDVLKEMYKMN